MTAPSLIERATRAGHTHFRLDDPTSVIELLPGKDGQKVVRGNSISVRQEDGKMTITGVKEGEPFYLSDLLGRFQKIYPVKEGATYIADFSDIPSGSYILNIIHQRGNFRVLFHR